MFFFDELVISSVNSPVTTHEVLKATRMVKDIGNYLDKETRVLHDIQAQSKDQSIQWYLDGRDRIFEMLGDLSHFDSVIANCVHIIEQNENNHLLTETERINGQILDVKQELLQYKTYADIAIAYRELLVNIIGGIACEIDNCAKILRRIAESSIAENPLKNAPIEELVDKLKIMDLSCPSEILLHINSGSIYNDFRDLEMKVEPLHASIGFLPYKLEEFERICSSYSITATQEVFEITKSSERLERQWALLKESVTFENHRLVENQWRVLLSRIIDTVIVDSKTLSALYTDNAQSSNEFGAKYKQCSNLMALLGRAAKNSILNCTLTVKYKEVAHIWNELNLSLNSTSAKSVVDSKEFEGLKKFHSSKVSGPTAGIKPLRLENKDSGLGLDLGLDVKSSQVPYSVQKQDRVRDFLGMDEQVLPLRRSKNILEEFKLLSVADSPYDDADHDEDDDETLVNSKTPQSLIEESEPRHSKVTGLGPSEMDLGSPFVMQYGWPLLEERSLVPSRIPVICPNYHLMKVAEIVKTSGPTKIPSISPLHPVFLHSPERETLYSRSQFLGRHSRQSSSHSTIAFPSPTPLRSELESTRILPKARLSLKSTPNLSYVSPSMPYGSPIYLNTSSTANEVIWHQPVHTPKPRWK